jgi:transcription elongation factor GreA
MNDKPVLLTAEGRALIDAEYEHLVNVRRIEVAAQIGTAADDGDLSENAAYDHAKDEQAHVEGRIATLQHFRRNAVLIDEHPTSDVVALGSTVTIEEDGTHDTYTILGPLEAAPNLGRISNESPMGRALLNHRTGDIVDVYAPSGVRAVRILSIQ